MKTYTPFFHIFSFKKSFSVPSYSLFTIHFFTFVLTHASIIYILYGYIIIYILEFNTTDILTI